MIIYFCLAVTGEKEAVGCEGYSCVKMDCLVLFYFDRIVASGQLCHVIVPLCIVIQSKVWRLWRGFAAFQGQDCCITVE